MMRLAAFVLALAACAPDDLVIRGDPTFPIPVRSGLTVPLLTARLGKDKDHVGNAFPLVVDTACPLTAIWPQATAPGPMDLVDPACASVEPLRISTGDGRVPRLALEFNGNFRYWCTPPGRVGVGDGAMLLGGVLGGDVLSRYAVRFAREGPNGEATVQLYEDLFEHSDQLAADGSVVITVNPGGGGKLLAADGVSRLFPRSMVAVRTCLDPAPYDPTGDVVLGMPPKDLGEGVGTGSPAMLIVSSGAPVSMIARSTYDRLSAGVAAEGSGRTLALEPAAEGDVIYMPGVTQKSHEIEGRRAAPVKIEGWVTLPLLALVARDVFTTDASEVDPNIDACRELARARSLTQLGLHGVRDLPRTIAPHVELAPTSRIPVVPDDAPFLVAARQQAGNRIAVVDGVLGSDLISLLDFEIGYAGRDGEPSRVVLRCIDSMGCVARPRCTLERAKQGLCPRAPQTMTPAPGALP